MPARFGRFHRPLGRQDEWTSGRYRPLCESSPVGTGLSDAPLSWTRSVPGAREKEGRFRRRDKGELPTSESGSSIKSTTGRDTESISLGAVLLSLAPLVPAREGVLDRTRFS